MFTLLSLFQLVAGLPVYLFNSEISGFQGNIAESEFPVVVSHFLGDGKEALTEQSEGILRQIASPFLETRTSSVVVVNNFDEKAAEALFGSAQFTADNGAASWLAERSSFWVSPQQLAEREASADQAIVRVNAERNNVDYNLEVLQYLKSTDARIMLVGVPAAQGIAKKSASALRAAGNSSQSSSPAGPPAFFDSEDACNEQTNSCSQHGKCVKTSTGFYSCRCSPTKVDDYTYYWGGNDCSKRDVSFQFSLLVGTTLAIVAAGVLSVKLLFNLGSEQLPGILTS